MRVGDAVQQALPELQAEAESLMRTTARVTRTGTPTTDPQTGVVSPDGPVLHEAMKCRVKSRNVQARQADAAGAMVTLTSDEVHFPVTAGPFQVGDMILITESLNQPHLIGNRYRVAVLHEAEFQTAQRLGVEAWESMLQS